jgi:plastin-1
MTQRAAYIIKEGKRIGAEFVVQPKDITNGNSKLNLAFIAALFNAAPGLDPPDEEMLGLMDELADDDTGDNREERAFRMWINSLGLPEDTYVANLYEDVRDGLVILRTMDHVRPGCVDWSKVNSAEKCTMVFKKVENTNYCVDLSKDPFKFSLVGVGGKDIVDGNKKLTLALMWQLMRCHLLTFLESLRSKAGGSTGKPLADEDSVKWANETVAALGSSRQISGFNDSSIGSSLFFIDLLEQIQPRCVNRDLVTEGVSEDDKKLNAKYAISCARKLGCAVFLLWEDIVEVKPKMILSFLAAVMGYALEHPRKK